MRKMDSEGLAVFEQEGVRHEVLVKINKLAMCVNLSCRRLITALMNVGSEDARHGLKEVAALDIVLEGEQKKGISVSSLTHDALDSHSDGPSITTLFDISP